MNGKKDVLLFNVGSDKNFTEASKTTKVPAGTKANGWTLKLKAITKAGTDNTTYWVDGEKLTVETVGDNKQIKVDKLTGLTLTYLDKTDPENPVYKKITLSNVDNLDTATLALADLSDVNADEKGEVHLYRAWSVLSSDTSDDGVFQVYSEFDTSEDAENTPIGNSEGSDEYYVPVKGTPEEKTIYIEGIAGVLLAKAAEYDKDLVALPSNTQVRPVKIDGDSKAVWTYLVDGNIDADSFVSMVKFGGEDADTVKVTVNKAVSANKASDGLVIAGINLKSETTPVTINVVDFTPNKTAGNDPKDQALAAVTTSMVKVSQTKGADTLSVVITPAEAITLPADAAQEDAGSLTLIVNGVTVVVTVGVAQAAGGGTP